MNVIGAHISNLPESLKEKYAEVEIILSASIYDMHQYLFNCGRYKGYKVIRWHK